MCDVSNASPLRAFRSSGFATVASAKNMEYIGDLGILATELGVDA